jgi:hypothetical protein
MTVSPSGYVSVYRSTFVRLGRHARHQKRPKVAGTQRVFPLVCVLSNIGLECASKLQDRAAVHAFLGEFSIHRRKLLGFFPIAVVVPIRARNQNISDDIGSDLA